jgi:acylphosphatase
MQKIKRIVMYGLVQGVFFRESMVREANRLGVTGWVRNKRDGSVEAMLQGQGQSVEKLIEWAKNGLERARVDRMEIADGSGDYASFTRLPTE